MIERPFSLTNAELRAAAIEGLKTHTRTPMKKQPKYIEMLPADASPGETAIVGGEIWRCSQYSKNQSEAIKWRKSKPPWQVGDMLRLQEPYRIETGLQCGYVGRIEGVYLDDNNRFDEILTCSEWDLWLKRKFPYRGTSGRFMYESLARHRFKVTGIGAEQIRDISEVDCVAEGVIPKELLPCSPYEIFASVWDSIYGEGEYSWAKNPWVWKQIIERFEDE